MSTIRDFDATCLEGVIDMEEELKNSVPNRSLGHRFNYLLDKFFYSGLYVLLLGIIVFVCWLTESEVAGIGILVVFASVYLAFKNDITPLLPIVFLVAMMFPKDVDPTSYGAAFCLLIPLPIGIAVHLVRFSEKPKTGKMFFPQLAVSAALLLGGIGSISTERYAAGLTYALMLGALILLLYFLFYNYCKPPESVDLKRYLSMILLVVGLVIIAQVAVYYIKSPDKLHIIGGSVNIGWAIGNNFSTILLFAVSGCFYLAKSSRYSFFYLAVAVLEYIAVILSWSRGSTMFAAIILPFFLVYLIYSAKENRKNVLFSLGILLAVFAVSAGVFFDEIKGVVSGILEQGVGVSGRDMLYAEAWQCFLANPLFGAGIGFEGQYYSINNMPMYWFHSTLFQVFGSMGLIGIAAYAWYYAARYRVLCRRDSFNVFILIGMVGFEGYSMMDTGTFVPVPIMLEVILITMLVEFIDKNEQKKRHEFEPYRRKARPLS